MIISSIIYKGTVGFDLSYYMGFSGSFEKLSLQGMIYFLTFFHSAPFQYRLIQLVNLKVYQSYLLITIRYFLLSKANLLIVKGRVK